MLKDLGCEVVTAASGMDAIERLSENAKIELLVTDLNMPGVDGYELAQRAAATRPTASDHALGRELDGRGWRRPEAVLAARSRAHHETDHRAVLGRRGCARRSTIFGQTMLGTLPVIPELRLSTDNTGTFSKP